MDFDLICFKLHFHNSRLVKALRKAYLSAVDILSHTLTGTAFATVVASFCQRNWRQRAGIIALGTFGGALPDLDAISLWSGFDGTFGKWLGLLHRGEEIYYGKFWYSHHAALHSVTAAFLLPLIFLVSYTLISGRRSMHVHGFWNRFTQLSQRWRFGLIAFIGGMVFHMLEDMPTPSSSWGGVALFWPNSTYYGGAGKIWWWNNYDLFLLIVLVIMMNSIILLFAKKIKWKAFNMTPLVFVAGIIAYFYLMNLRDADYNNRDFAAAYASFNQQSLDYQKELLGEEVFGWMQRLDHWLPVHF